MIIQRAVRWPRVFGVLALLALAAAFSRAQVTVEAVVVQPEAIVEPIPLTGSVSALQLSSLSAEVSGVVKRADVYAGDHVAAGEPLLQLDSELTRLALDGAEAHVARAQAQEAEAQRLLAEAQDLVREHNIAATEVGARQAALASAQADRQVAEADRALTQARLKKHSLTAPFAGTVSVKHIDVGEWVEPGTALLELVSTEQLRVDFQVPQRYFHRINQQARLTMTLDSAPNETFTAVNLRKVPLSRPGARTFLLRASLPADVPQSIPGMAVSATLNLDAGRRSVTVPRDALLRYPDGRTVVWVAESDSFGEEVAVSEVQVTPGVAFAGRVEITQGLSGGQVVVTRGNEALQQGQRVQLRRSNQSN
jgi:RND family efflux transporter MFP subunit